MYFDLFSGKRLTVWNRMSVLFLEVWHFGQHSCCPSPQHTQRASCRGVEGRALSDLADAALLFCGGGSAQGVRRTRSLDYLKGIKGNVIPFFQGYGLSPRGFLHIQTPPLSRKPMRNVLSVCPPIKLCGLSAGLRELTSLSSLNAQPFVIHLCLRRPSEVRSKCLLAEDHIERMSRPHTILLWNVEYCRDVNGGWCTVSSQSHNLGTETCVINRE